MSFGTFWGTDPTNLVEYQKILPQYLPAGGGGGIAAVNAGTNISIPNPAVPVVAVRNPLNAPLNIGTQNITGTTAQVQIADAASAANLSSAELTFTDVATPAINSQFSRTAVEFADGVATTSLSAGGIAETQNLVLEIQNNAVGGGIQLNTNAGAGTISTNSAFQPQRILDTAGGAGTAGQVLSSLGGVAGTAWVPNGGGGGGVPIVNCVPWGYEIGLTGSTGVMKSAPAVEFMFGQFSTTISNLYDTTTGSPPLYQNAVFCECFVNCNIPEGVFIPNLPYSAGTPNPLNDPNPAGVPATQILWHLQYELSTAVGTLVDFDTPCYAGTPVLNFPQLTFSFLPAGNYFNSSAYLVGLLDITGIPAATTITFHLNAYTNTGSIDTRATTGGTQGSISMRCFPVRHP